MKRINATSMSADSCSGMDINSPYFDAIKDARVSPGLNSEEGSRIVPPITMLTAIVSPNARPKPRSIAAMMLGAEARNTTFLTVSHFVAPTERDASFKERGIASKDSMHNEMMMGNTMIDKMIAAENMQRPVLCAPKNGAITFCTKGAKKRKAHNP